MTAIMFE